MALFTIKCVAVGVRKRLRERGHRRVCSNLNQMRCKYGLIAIENVGHTYKSQSEEKNVSVKIQNAFALTQF